MEGDGADTSAVGDGSGGKVRGRGRGTRGYRNRSRGSGREAEGVRRGSPFEGRHRNGGYKHGRNRGRSGGEHNLRILGSDEDEDRQGVSPEKGWDTAISSDGEYGGMVEEKTWDGIDIDEAEGWVTVARKKKEKERRGRG